MLYFGWRRRPTRPGKTPAATQFLGRGVYNDMMPQIGDQLDVPGDPAARVVAGPVVPARLVHNRIEQLFAAFAARRLPIKLAVHRGNVPGARSDLRARLGDRPESLVSY